MSNLSWGHVGFFSGRAVRRLFSQLLALLACMIFIVCFSIRIKNALYEQSGMIPVLKESWNNCFMSSIKTLDQVAVYDMPYLCVEHCWQTRTRFRTGFGRSLKMCKFLKNSLNFENWRFSPVKVLGSLQNVPEFCLNLEFPRMVVLVKRRG